MSRYKTPIILASYSASPTTGARSNQSKVWADVARKQDALAVTSSSGAMHDIYNKYDKSVGDYLRHFEASKDQVGAVFAINGRIVGADIFDQNTTLKKLFPKLIKSYALDAIEEKQSKKKVSLTSEKASAFIRQTLAKDVKMGDYDSAGDGRDVRITSKSINGASLVASNRPVHIALFAAVQAAQEPLGEQINVAPASRRTQSRR